MKSIFNLPGLIVAGWFLAVASSSAASFTNLYDFSGSTTGKNGDGIGPEEVVLSDGTLFGAATDGGGNGLGTVFAVRPNGSPRFVNLHDFGPTFDLGSGPLAPVVVSGGVIYGTTRAGGTNGLGTVFSLSTNGTGFTVLHSFGLQLGTDPATGGSTNSGGAFPRTALICSNNTLYGATEEGGSGGYGTVFKMNTDGGGFTVLHNFNSADGDFPSVHMVLIGTNLFGTTEFGGIGDFFGGGGGGGVIFRVDTGGLVFTNLHLFTNSEANSSFSGLVSSGNALYGTGTSGGTYGLGGIFSINADGSDYTNHSINGALDLGGGPSAGVAVNGQKIYFTATGSDSFGGTVFQINTDGSGYTNLTAFNNPGDPGVLTGLIYSGGNLYCTASSGGANNSGTVFALGVSPTPIPLSFFKSGNALVLSWSDPAFSLFAAPAVTGTYTNVPSATSPYTNHFTSPQKFFRLQAN